MNKMYFIWKITNNYQKYFWKLFRASFAIYAEIFDTFIDEIFYMSINILHDSIQERIFLYIYLFNLLNLTKANI